LPQPVAQIKRPLIETITGITICPMTAVTPTIGEQGPVGGATDEQEIK
jgi:hypothetical protein